MKMKMPSLNPAALGEFLLRHVEKPVFAGLGVLALLLAWGGIDAIRSQAVKPDRTPVAIKDLAGQATRNIDRASKLPADLLPPRQPLQPVIDPWRAGRATIAAAPTDAAMLSRPLVAELAKRTKPDVVPIEDLRAVSGIAVLPGPGGPGAPRRPDLPDPRVGPPQEPGAITPFVVVTGLIPAAKQQQEFARRFSSASWTDEEKDRPRWGQYLVERVRVTAAGDGGWKTIYISKPAAPAGAGGPPPGEEPLPPAFLLGPGESEFVYAAPLPRRIDEPWAASGLHPWILARIAELRKKRITEEQPAADAPLTLADLVNKAPPPAGREFPLAGVTLDANPQRQRGVGYRFVARTAEPAAVVPIGEIGPTTKPVFAVSEAWGQTLAFEGATSRPLTGNLRCRVELADRTPVIRILVIQTLDEAGKPRDTLVDPAPAPIGNVAAPVAPDIPAGPQRAGEIGPAENRLFRFVDLDVKPGESYRYRVKFALLNPNDGVPPQHLADLNDRLEQLLISPVSNETQPVRVPDPVRILARTIDAALKRQLRLKAGVLEVMILAPSEQTGNFALRSTLTDVGGLANVTPAQNGPGESRFFGEPVTTDRLLVAAHGRQEDRAAIRSADPPEPLEMLFLRPDGGFDVVAAAECERQIERYGSTLFKPGTRLPNDGRPERRGRERDTPADGP